MAERPLKIMAVTGSRAGRGYLSVPLGLLRADPAFQLFLVVTGQHLDPSSGGTARMLVPRDLPLQPPSTWDRAAAASRRSHDPWQGLAGFGDVVASLKPDLMLLLGDRYETLAAGCAALLSRCPVAHIAGGDTSEGAVDDAIRHALTKLGHVHFPTNQDAADPSSKWGRTPRMSIVWEARDWTG